MIRTNTQKHFQWALESGAVLIVIGVALNVLVMHTLGSFDAATVILTLFLGFWAFVLGNSVLFFSSIWLFLRRRDLDIALASTQPPTREHSLRVQPLQRTQPCHC